MRSILYVARHGETDWNAEGRWQGHTDVPLNVNGVAQALVLARRLRGEGIAAVAASDLSRARATAEAAAGDLGLTLAYVDADLRERSYGLFEGLTRAGCVAKYPGEWARYEADPRAGPPESEPQEALVLRVGRGLVRAAAELPSPALVVSHGGSIRAIVGSVRGEPAGPVPNGGVYRLVVENARLVEATFFDGAEESHGAEGVSVTAAVRRATER